MFPPPPVEGKGRGLYRSPGGQGGRSIPPVPPDLAFALLFLFLTLAAIVVVGIPSPGSSTWAEMQAVENRLNRMETMVGQLFPGVDPSSCLYVSHHMAVDSAAVLFVHRCSLPITQPGVPMENEFSVDEDGWMPVQGARVADYLRDALEDVPVLVVR